MKKNMRLITMILLLLGLALLAGCTTSAEEPEVVDQPEAAETVPQEAEEPKAKQGILVVSFGTSYADTREASLDACEAVIQDAFPDYEVRRAFTSQIIINKLADRDNIIIDNPLDALTKMKEEGFTEVIVQPLHIIPGEEFNELAEVVSSFNDGSFETLALGSPILTQIEDYKIAAEALEIQIPDLGEGEAVVLMGHGTHHPANASYACFQSVISDMGMSNVYVGTVEGYPEIDHVLAALKQDEIHTVTLMPFMVVAGDHANNDMAGEEEDSWKTLMKKEGYSVSTYLHGIGENAAFQEIYLAHVRDAISGNGYEIHEASDPVQAASTNWEEGKKAIMVVSFGTSYADTRKASIEATENAIAQAYPEYDVVRAFTSQFIIDKLKKRDNIEIFNPVEAFENLMESGYEEVVVQPLHIMQGEEYHELLTIFNTYQSEFKSAAIGKPLLYHIDDYKTAVQALETQLPEMGEGEAVVLMGHGTHHPANSTYACFDSVLKSEGHGQVYVGTVEGYPEFDDIMEQLKADEIQEVTLMPMMVVAGDHASNDMAGDEEDSWKTLMKKEGLTVNIYLHGIGENAAFQQMYVDHIQDALDGK